MNNNTLGIIGIVAGSVVALGGIAGIALQKRANAWANFRPGSASGGDTYGIVLQLPGAPDSTEWQAINDVLTKSGPAYKNAHREELYRIRYFQNGMPSPTPPPSPTPKDEDLDSGKLPTEQLLFDRDKTVERLKTSNFTGYAFQIGVGGKDSYQKIPLNAVTMPQGRGRLNMRESREMVEEINDILDQ